MSNGGWMLKHTRIFGAQLGLFSLWLSLPPSTACFDGIPGRHRHKSVFILVPHLRHTKRITHMPLCDIWQQRRATHFQRNNLHDVAPTRPTTESCEPVFQYKKTQRNLFSEREREGERTGEPPSKHRHAKWCFISFGLSFQTRKTKKYTRNAYTQAPGTVKINKLLLTWFGFCCCYPLSSPPPLSRCPFISHKPIHNALVSQRMEIVRVKSCLAVRRTSRCSCLPHCMPVTRDFTLAGAAAVVLRCCVWLAVWLPLFRWMREMCRQLYCAKNSTSFARIVFLV